jgi:bifunctional DNA primase/polymerase-like protein
MTNTDVLFAAKRYLARGFMPIPIPIGKKRPIVCGWTKLRIRETDLSHHFNGTGNIGLLLGEPSGWLVDVDLDCDEAVELADEYLPPTHAITGRSSRLRSHRWYISIESKTKKRTDPHTGAMIVELRSTGTQTLVGPSIHPDGDAYELLEGEPTPVHASTLVVCVDALTDAVIERRYGRSRSADAQPGSLSNSHTATLPKDQVERRAAAYLDRIPPAVSGHGGHSQTYAAATAMVHGFMLESEVALNLLLERYNPRCDPPWSEKELRHKVEEAATKTHDRPLGWLRDAGARANEDVDLSAIVASTSVPHAVKSRAEAPVLLPKKPDALPPEAFRVPGFIGEVMDHCLATAPYPNHTMAFCGALALQAYLAGRVVRDQADNRTNIYLLGLAHSSAGKDWPRKINSRVLLKVGLTSSLADQFASGEGIQDALYTNPCMLFQTDEIDALLQSIKRSRDPRYESIMATLLTMYSASNSVYPLRRKANNPDPGFIIQPCLVLFGTAIPNHYYSALSERMLTNGFFARMIVLESGPRAAGQEVKAFDPPERILESASWWADLRSGPIMLTDLSPAPRTVEQTANAKRLLIDLRKESEFAYARAESKSDAVATTVWGRVSENVRKLALLYAVSENHKNPEIGAEGVQWASELIMHQTNRMLFMADGFAAESEFDELALRLLRKLRDAAGGTLPHSVLLKRMKMDHKRFHDLMDTLKERGDVIEILVKTRGRDARHYKLIEKEGEERVKEDSAE